MSVIPEGSAVLGTHFMSGGCDYGPGETGGCKMLAATDIKMPAEELQRTVHILQKGHPWIRRHRQALDPTAKEKRQFHWSPDADAAFQSLKEALCTTPVLGHPQQCEMFIVDTDASSVVIGVLSQVQDGQE
jgi:hypothetical protein